MELDQLIFKKAIDFFKRINKKSATDNLLSVDLETMLSRLTIIARALTAEDIDISAAEKEGGWKNNVFYLPATFSLLPTIEDNVKFYIFRTVYLSVQAELGLNWKSKEKNIALQNSREEAKLNAEFILKKIEADYPAIFKFYSAISPQFGIENKKSELIPDYWLFGKYMLGSNLAAKKKSNGQGENATNNQGVKPETEIKSKPVEEAEVINVDKKSQEDYVMTHNFEKVDTAEEFKGVWRDFDGDDSLQKDQEALDELNLKHMVRTDDEVHSVYQADFRDIHGIAESADGNDKGKFVTYNEWNHQKNEYRKDYCKVFIKRINGSSLDYASSTISDNASTLDGIRRKFAQIHQKRMVVRKMADGEDIDIDAVVEMFTDIHSGHTPSENIYISKRKKEPDISILFLVDLSLSTDSYSDGNRILDVEKQAVILFGQVLNEYNVDFAVGGFYSKTRNNCSYINLKDFNDDWSKARRNIGAAEPRGYTRIGPALRHAKTLIGKQQAQNKWIILLSDGKPNDYDKYEGRYGVADVKQALRELHEYHINSYAIAIESTARYYLPQMFGQNHYNILSHPSMLLHSLTTLYQRIQNK